MDTKKLLGYLALGAGAGYVYLSLTDKKVQKLSGSSMNGFKLNPHKMIDMAMGMTNMNPIAKTIISEGLKKTVGNGEEGEVIDADYEVL